MPAKLASKSSIKVILEKYAKGKTKLTFAQAKVLLDTLILKKPTYSKEQRRMVRETSEYTLSIVAPLYADMQKTGQAPHRALVFLALAKLNQPFFRKKKNQEQEEEPMAKEAKSKTVKSNYVSTKSKPKHNEAELKQKLHKQWKEKTSEAWKGNCPIRKIKSVGNGL